MNGPGLAALAFLVDTVVVAATHSWPIAASSAVVYLLLGLAWCLSIAAYVTLRSHGGGGGPEALPPDPDPPWWPEFERQFRDYERGRHRRRQPIGS